MGLGYALTKIPWKSILPYVPTVVETARELLRNLGKTTAAQSSGTAKETPAVGLSWRNSSRGSSKACASWNRACKCCSGSSSFC